MDAIASIAVDIYVQVSSPTLISKLVTNASDVNELSANEVTGPIQPVDPTVARLHNLIHAVGNDTTDITPNVDGQQMYTVPLQPPHLTQNDGLSSYEGKGFFDQDSKFSPSQAIFAAERRFIQHDVTQPRQRYSLSFQRIFIDSHNRDGNSASVPQSIGLLDNIVIVMRPAATLSASSVPPPAVRYMLGKDIGSGDFDTRATEHWTVVYVKSKVSESKEVAIDDDQQESETENDDPRHSTDPVLKDNKDMNEKTQQVTAVPGNAPPKIFSIESIRQFIHTSTMNNHQPSWYTLDELYGPSSSIHSLDRLSAAPEDQPQCVICLSDPAHLLILPCRHLCMCLDCWKNSGLESAPPSAGAPTTSNTNEPISNRSRTQEEEGYGIENAQPRTNAYELDSLDGKETKWTSCPVCRGDVRGWIEMSECQRRGANRAVRTAPMESHVRSPASIHAAN